MKKVLITAAIALATTMSWGQNLKQGTQEIVAGGNLTPETISGFTTALNLRYGQFVLDDIEGGLAASFSDNDQGTVYDLAAFGEYNFDLGTELVPFIGAELGYRYLDLQGVDINDAIILSISAGAKYFLSENIAIRAAANASLASDTVFADNNKVKDMDYNLTLGMAFYIP